MSGHESIKEQEEKLNRHKNNVVTAVQHFVSFTKEIGQKIKDKEAAEGILITSKGSEKYTSVDIPDLKIHGGPTPVTGEVKIKYPTNDSQHFFDTDIKLKFETEHVHAPFDYVVIGVEQTSKTPFLIKEGISHEKSPPEFSIKEEGKNRLSVGIYDIFVRILDPTKKKDIAMPGKVTIKINPLGIGPGANTVKLISPSADSSPYTSARIAITFKVDGPYHNSSSEYIYAFICENKTKGISLAPIYGRATVKGIELSHATPLNLENGEYKAHLKIIEPGPTMKEISHSNPITFVVNAGSGPTPPGPVGPTPGPIGPTVVNTIINNIIINNNVNVFNVNLPFSMPINMEISPNHEHINEVIAQPINIWITVTRDETSKVEQTTKDIIVGGELKHTLKEELIFKSEGKYSLYIVLHRGDKPLFRKMIQIEIKNKEPKTPITRNKAAPYVELDGGEIGEVSTVSANKPHKIIIDNRGGGTLAWSIDYPPYINIVSSTKKLKEGVLEGKLRAGGGTEIYFEHNTKFNLDPKLFPNHILIKTIASGAATRYKIDLF